MADPDVADWMGSERSVLVHYLDKMRDAVVRTSAGLTDEEAGMPGVPSGTSLLGLIHHLTEVEAHWFRRVFAGEDIDMEMSMDVPEDMRRDDVVAAYRRECARSDAIVAACPDLGTPAAIANPGEDAIDPLRVIADAHDRGDRAARGPCRHPPRADRRRHERLTRLFARSGPSACQDLRIS